MTDDGNTFDPSKYDGAYPPNEDWRRELEEQMPEPGSYEPEEVRPIRQNEHGPLAGRIIDPREWEGKPVPQRHWCVPGFIPGQTVTSLNGDGGGGKSTVMAQLCVSRACGKPWLNIPIKPGRTILWSAEDDADELHRRIAAIARAMNVPLSDLGNLTLVDVVGMDAVLGALNRANNIITPTALYYALQRLIMETGADLVIADSLADIFSGDENQRPQARQFVGLLKRLCREHNITVVIIAHPSVAGMANGSGTSGSTAWNNSVRSRLYFETDKGADGREGDADLRTLTVKKANYGPIGGQILVRYQNGVFAPLDQGGTLDRAARDARADQVFLDLLRLHIETGQDVSAKPSASYAPSRFAAHPDSAGLSKSELAGALQRLLKGGKIAIETVGPQSRRTTRLIVSGGAHGH